MICVDASLAVKWIVAEEGSTLARSLYGAATRAGQRIIAPPLLPIEVTNVLRKRIRRISLTADDALTAFLTLPIELHNPPGLHQRALSLAITHNLPATYDAHYIALAEHFGCDLWAADQRMLRSVSGHLHFVRSLADFTGPLPST